MERALSSPSASPLLQVSEVRKHFGPLPVLRGISFAVDSGDFITIVGPNGAGKSTLLNCISMVLCPSSGTIECLGQDIRKDPNGYRRMLGYISHYLFLYGELSGLENLRFYARLYGIDADTASLEERLHSIGLFAPRHQPVRTYSRGMKQRLAIVRALLHEPRVVLLDEPFTGLDQHASAILRDLLLRLKAQERTVIMISHHLEHALEMGSRILILVRGRIRSELSAAAGRDMVFREHYMEIVNRHGGEG